MAPLTPPAREADARGAVPLRLILDTNIWLDWLVFADAGIADLRVAVDAGRAVVYCNAECEAELARVLDYPRKHTTLDAAAQARALDTFRGIVRPVTDDMGADPIALPRCADADDQKFLELARAAGAHALVTKDRALLVLDRRRNPQLPFRVVTLAGLGPMLKDTA